MLNIIYYLEKQALYDNFFLYPVVIESSLIYVGAWSTLSNIFLMNKKHSLSFVRSLDLHHLLTLIFDICRRSLDNLLVSCQAVGSSACLVLRSFGCARTCTTQFGFLLLFQDESVSETDFMNIALPKLGIA